MMRDGARRGYGLALLSSMLVLAVLIVVAARMTSSGSAALQLERADTESRQALYAAEAGIGDALYQLSLSSAWSSGFSNVSLPTQTAGLSLAYSVTVVNNFSGGGVLTASNGTAVPAGRTYLLATGMVINSTLTRTTFKRLVGVMVKGSSGGAYTYAVASMGNLLLGDATVTGALKSSGNINVGGGLSVTPYNGAGHLLANGNIDLSNNTITMTSPSEDVRAAGNITGIGSITGTTAIVSGDTTAATTNFIYDGRTSNTLNGGESGDVFPNPNQTTLLAGAITQSSTSVSGTFNLGGGTYYFPNGVTFDSSAVIVGPGTIVVGAGATFNNNIGTASSPASFNIVSLAKQPLKLNGAVNLQGMIYAQGEINTASTLTLQGSLLAAGNLNLKSGAVNVTLAPPPSLPSAFASWFGSGSGSSALAVVSWQRF
jgi:hypothetical protein